MVVVTVVLAAVIGTFVLDIGTTVESDPTPQANEQDFGSIGTKGV